MTIERLFPSGDYLCSDIINGEYVKVRYSYYTKREATKLFKHYCKNL
jgi:hypothetical protein